MDTVSESVLPSKPLFPRISSFWFGITLPARAARLILNRPKLLTLSAIPIAITLALYFYLISAIQKWAVLTLNGYFQAWGWDPQGWAAGALLIFSKLLLILVGALTFSIAASIVASPFNDFLAEATEPHSAPALLPAAKTTAWGQIRMVFIDLLKTLAAAAGTLMAILLSWVPVLNLFAFMVACLLVTFQYISYPQTRRRQGLVQGLRFLGDHFFACLGFGMAFSFLFAIPLLACLALPLAVVGGTLLFARAQKSPSQFLLK